MSEKANIRCKGNKAVTAMLPQDCKRLTTRYGADARKEATPSREAPRRMQRCPLHDL